MTLGAADAVKTTWQTSAHALSHVSVEDICKSDGMQSWRPPGRRNLVLVLAKTNSPDTQAQGTEVTYMAIWIVLKRPRYVSAMYAPRRGVR